MSVDPISIGLTGFRLWRELKPWRRLKIARNKRRARLGKPLLPISEDDMQLFPNGSMTKSGASIAAAGPIITAVLTAFGVGAGCAPGAMGCVTADQWAGILVTVAGAIIAWLGRNRAEKTNQVAVAIAAATGEVPTPAAVAKVETAQAAQP